MVNNFTTNTATNDSVTIGSSSTSVLAANTVKQFIILTNDSDETIYLALGETAVASKGIRLNANGGSLSLSQREFINGAINAICASGSKNLCITYY